MSFETKMYGATALLLVATIITCIFVTKSSREERQECLDQGGRITDVHGGRGGWICTYDSKGERP